MIISSLIYFSIYSCMVLDINVIQLPLWKKEKYIIRKKSTIFKIYKKIKKKHARRKSQQCKFPETSNTSSHLGTYS